MRSPSVGTAVRPGQGVVGIYASNTALHGDARYGLTFVLIVSASIALRIGRSSRHG